MRAKPRSAPPPNSPPRRPGSSPAGNSRYNLAQVTTRGWMIPPGSLPGCWPSWADPPGPAWVRQRITPGGSSAPSALDRLATPGDNTPGNRLTGRFAGQQEGLLHLLHALAGLAQQPSVHDQPGLAQQLGDTVRLPPVKIERHRMAERLRHVQRPVADLEGEQHVAARGQHPVEL